MNLPRTLKVLLASDLLTLSRACGVLRAVSHLAPTGK